MQRFAEGLSLALTHQGLLLSTASSVFTCLAGEESDLSSGEYSRSSSPSIFGAPEGGKAIRHLGPPDLPGPLLQVVKDCSATILMSGASLSWALKAFKSCRVVGCKALSKTG